jgi:hypothetical protein
MTAAAESLPRWLLLPAAVFAWVVADLYLPITMPGAPQLEHLAFIGVGGLARFLEMEAATNVLVLDVGLVGAAILGPLALWQWSRGGRRAWQLALAGLALAQLGVIVVASLMERGGAAGLLAATLVIGLRRPLAPPADGVAGPREAVGGLSIAALPGMYVLAVFTASSDGYRLLDLLGSARGPVLYGVWAAGALAMAVLCARRFAETSRMPAGRTMAHAAGAAILATGLAKLTIDPGLSWLSVVVLGPVVAAVVVAVQSRTGPFSLDPLRWPRLLLPATLGAVLLFGHAYAARVLACPTDLPAGVDRIADGDDIFEVALGKDGAVLAMSSRSGRRFLALDLQPDVGTLRAVRPDAIPSPPQDDVVSGTTYAYAEEIEYLPVQDQFLGTLVVVSDDFFTQENPPDLGINNALVLIGGDGGRAEHMHGRPGLCWIGNMAWDERRSRVLLGCEYEARIWTYDPVEDTVSYGFEAAELADVAAFSVDPREGRDFVYTVSMWTGDKITKLDGESLEVRQQSRVGDAHYALELDTGTGRLFASSYYRSVVTVIDADDLRIVDSIPTGLGARAVGVDSTRGLVVASSVYDGLVRVCRTDTAEVVRLLRVGGHVKDIAVDEARGLAYFANPCGVFRIDLNVVSEG